MKENESEIARFRQQQALQEQAAQQGLSGLAVVTQHKFITARMERGAERVLRLIEEGRYEAAKALLFSDDLWAQEELGGQKQCQEKFPA